MTMPTRRDGGGGGNVVGQPTYSTPGATASRPNAVAPQGQSTARRGFFSGFFGNNSAATAGSVRPAATPSTGQPAMQGRGFGGQPQYNTGGQPSRSYSQPSYSPSRSFGGGGYGGGGGRSFGGGGGGGRRGGR
ncbi:hypothetical protein [Hymenobacter sp. BRD67]|uniref:hypothetical protein n=1 Tax=Hymenobacter sp. BRD67 TaxID=2675877 RepID=UPI001565F18F|nr:hypothetical protein [Hymenobacter sp. BRD67]QKG54397.1 hypothetical protein GKZ67_19565 [Hymenobacter sp. BRD67]